jgi:hypothetical protein
MPEVTRAKTLHQGQFNRLIKITQATSRYPERDVLVLILGHHSGMRITVADVMHASGKLRSEISMREAITKGCRHRCIPCIQTRDPGPGELLAVPDRARHRHRGRLRSVQGLATPPAVDLQQPGRRYVPEHQAASA